MRVMSTLRGGRIRPGGPMACPVAARWLVVRQSDGIGGEGRVDQIGTILTALAGLVVAVGGVLSQRRSRSPMDFRLLKKELRRQSKRFQVALLHIGRLEDHLVAHKVRVPTRPKELDPDWGLLEDEAPEPPKVGEKS